MEVSSSFNKDAPFQLHRSTRFTCRSDYSSDHIDPILDLLLNEDYTLGRSLCHRTLKLIDDVIATGHPDGLFLMGLCLYPDQAFEWWKAAEQKGSTNPLLYYFLGDCHRKGTRTAGEDQGKATYYYERSIQGMVC